MLIKLRIELNFHCVFYFSLFKRLEYDAYRNDLENVQMGPRDSTSTPRIEDAKTKFDEHKQKYETLRADVAIKLKFLEENKVTHLFCFLNNYFLIPTSHKFLFNSNTFEEFYTLI